jgi:hypothetical protein
MPPAPVTIDETATPIRVDGHLGEWPEARMIILGDRSQVVSGGINWKDRDRFNARVFLTYDAEYLYLSAIVKKSTRVVNENAGPSLWDGDCIEFFLSAYTSASGARNRVSRGDYHIGLSPGTDASDPKMYCFNKQREIGGGRVIARKTLNGYILEARIPFSFFRGLEMGPGKRSRFNLVVDAGGALSGSRLFQLDMTGSARSWEDPSKWGWAEWVGKTVQVSIPREDEADLYANLVRDGTKEATFWGRRTISGVVVDPEGKPIKDAIITTWPRTSASVTGEDGRFTLPNAKTYDATVIHAGADGYATSLAPVERSGAPVTVKLWRLPAQFTSLTGGISPTFFGQSFAVPMSGDPIAMMGSVREKVSGLGLGVLRLTGTTLRQWTWEEQKDLLDAFVAYARSIKAEPMIEIPIHRGVPTDGARWVQYCNLERKYGVRYWTVGNEPDLYAEKGADAGFSGYNVYDYINDFREIYNAVKRSDPTILVLGPELAWKYTSGEEDWLTPFVRYDGDIVNLISIHHYSAVKRSDGGPRTILEDVRRETTLLRSLKDRTAGNSENFIPLVVTGGNVCAEPGSGTVTARVSATPTITIALADEWPRKKGAPRRSTARTSQEVTGPDSFWAALWVADMAGVLLRENVGMGFYSTLKGNEYTDFLGPETPRPIYWALKIVATRMKGRPVWAQVDNNEVSTYAAQDPDTKDLVLLIINKGDDYYHPTMLLNGGAADLSVDAGLDEKFDQELPDHSIVVLNIRGADRSKAEVTLYSRKMAMEGLEPKTLMIKAW